MGTYRLDPDARQRNKLWSDSQVQQTLSEKKKPTILTPRNIGSVLALAIISGLGLAWLFIYVIIPIFSPFQYNLQYEVSFAFDILTAVLILFAVVYNCIDMTGRLARNRGTDGSVKDAEGHGAVQVQSVKRFSLNQRIQHAWLIVTVGICALTGFAQFYYQSWGQPVVLFLGGLQTNMDIHLASAFFLGILVVYHFAYYAFSYVGKRWAGQPAHLEDDPWQKGILRFLRRFEVHARVRKPSEIREVLLRSKVRLLERLLGHRNIRRSGTHPLGLRLLHVWRFGVHISHKRGDSRSFLDMDVPLLSHALESKQIPSQFKLHNRPPD